ncbi:hypothetical protein RF11_01140 [Thelohanellus kitauei]|uniref:FLYWCH-type domain-containing protein n=1 Tax=Thelohanellus kitauei TaxID=669202 RepID=A0A0C2MBG5_THEKT|nr:hypothetical protein RF11_01140 [Thelohanellus kitauei]
MASRRKIVHEDFTYQLNKKYKGTFYYRCSKFSESCQAKLVVKGDTFTVKGIHTCITINSIADENNAIIESREYSGLERYNRRLNDFFANAHPNIASFVTVIRNEFEFYSQVCAQVRQNSTSIDYGQGIFDKPAVAADYMIWKLNI